MKEPLSETVNLLWTGGWDSTFRLLQLLLVFESRVQPYYLINQTRPSANMEIKTMKTIEEQLFAKYPKTKELLLPTQFKEVSDIKPGPELTKAFTNIRSHQFMGSQYKWLAGFCVETGLEEIELSIHKDDKAHAVLKPFVKWVHTKSGKYCEVDKAFHGSDEFKLFRFFKFPLFDLSKLDMQAVARNKGFEDLLNLTWFCHKPRAGQPCGVCNPCIYTVQEGLVDRIPLSSRVRYHLRVRPRIAHLLMRYPKLYNFVENVRRKTI